MKSMVLLLLTLLAGEVQGQDQLSFQFVINHPAFGQGSFSEATGLGAMLEFTSSAADGDNAFQYEVPKAGSNADLVLKRGVINEASRFMTYVNESRIQPQDMTLQLLDSRGKVRRSWTFNSAYVVAHEVALMPDDSELVVESLSFAYTSMELRSDQ